MPGLVPKEDERSNSMKIILPDGSVQEAEDELRAIRHTASHVLAQAVKRLYPETKLAIGPAIDDGFYYDLTGRADSPLRIWRSWKLR